MESRTFTGKTADEATGIALKSLGVELEDVEIKVVSPGRSGILGLGGAPAVIEVKLLRKLDAPAPAAPRPPREQREPREPREVREPREPREPRERREPTPPAAPRAESAPKAEDVAAQPEGQREPGDWRGGRRRRGTGRQQPRDESAQPDAPARQDDAVAESGAAPSQPRGGIVAPRPTAMRHGASEEEIAADQDYPDAPPTERDAEAEEAVAKLLDYFLSSMGVVAETFVRDELDSGSLVFEIEGPDAGLLIGRRGETLQALQFMVRMITNRQLTRKSYVIIDVEGYRERRAEMLRNLARRTAGRVSTSERPASLEPMPPGERRIIHMALADNPRIRTESEGEGNRRHVVILPRRSGPVRGQPDDAEGAQEEGARPGFRQRRPRRGFGRRSDGPQGERTAEGVPPTDGADAPGNQAGAPADDRPAPDDSSDSSEESR